MPYSKQDKSFHFSSEKTGAKWCILKTQRRLALRTSSKPLAAGILESVFEGNKPLIKIQYLQRPLSNSRCRQGDFFTNNKERPATRSDSPGQAYRKLELHGTQKRDSTETKQHKKSPDL